MKDEVQRISRLVAEGKLSPEDAADLIDAFYASDQASAAHEEPRRRRPLRPVRRQPVRARIHSSRSWITWSG